MAEGKSAYKGWAAVSFIISVITLIIGLCKMFIYEGEHYPYRNAYVGGDAYNYIINGNYATAFFVLTATFALMGIGFLALYYLSTISEGNRIISDRLKKTYQTDAEIKQEQRAAEAAEREKREAERKKREEEEQIAKKAAREQAFEEYWRAHAEEREALIAKRKEAIEKLNQLGSFAGKEKESIQNLIEAIDIELSKDR